MKTANITLLTDQEMMGIFGGKTNWGSVVGSCVAGGLVGAGQDWISQK
ncbi:MULTISPECIES: class IIb bacteriocin, lactobin A/cerein 7B family [Enterococcus]|nr:MULTISPECIES: class IIb bacteriocin, lactobin A/cerein 7B family [Enterococcus]EME7220277.1 class IIb bacteriocin, lactobin A/cerein 7B family [Enterococcus faecium]EME8123680.1 class IIb bacteriocin, lactobin A/cerein 7B family [Enterococcus faecium]EOH54441.1 lactobin A/cerein 7B family class IIb bacteriocin [Enterococcus faecium EnGen0263]MBK5027317.1 class IIb bacteriocin, lactobin A/cerein 7B family [Enterococcus faecium]MBK5037942.1 class IIb bacteriocin, lactobin A/cerein 7B family [